MKKFKKKSYTIRLPISLVNRLQCIKKLRKGDIDMGRELYKEIEGKISEIEKRFNLSKDTWKYMKKCPKCDSNLVPRAGKNGKFMGCYNYPKCDYTEKYHESGFKSNNKNNSE